MRTFVTILAAALVAAPLVVLALRGTRLDPIRSTRLGMGLAPTLGPSPDAERAEHDLVAARVAREDAVGTEQPARHRRSRTTPVRPAGPRGRRTAAA